MPTLIVFSDMQFNEANPHSLQSQNVWENKKWGEPIGIPMHEVISRKFAETAKRLGWEDADPTPIVYWNLRNSGGGHPVEKDTEGTVLLSGFSPSMLKMVMNGEAFEDKEVEVVVQAYDGTTVVRTEKVRVTPSEVLRKSLDDTLYDPVRVILLESKEGILADYCTSEQGEEDFEMV